MAKRSKRDVNQINQFEHDEEAGAKRVKLIDTEMSMELNHADGDSVTSHPDKLSASSIGVDSDDDGTVIIPAMDCSSLRIIHATIDGTGDISVQVSLSDTEDHWVTVTNKDQPKEICARRVRVKSVNVVGNVHLVGRS